MNRDKIEILRNRIGALEESLAAEKARQQKAKAKLQAREFSLVGEALCKYATQAQSADFRLMLSQVLPLAVTDDKARRFLQERGWMK